MGAGGGEAEEEEVVAKCPFAVLGGPNPHEMTRGLRGGDILDQVRAKSAVVGGEVVQEDERRWPWPFVFSHDPATGIHDNQTWVVISLVSCCVLFSKLIVAGAK